MHGQNTEIEWLKASVSCALLLERLTPAWRLDRAQSTRHSLKYRRGAGEILIVSHGGRGWWDPLSTAKGDIFTLVQHLDPGLNFGGARRVLREFAGSPPASASVLPSRPSASDIPVALRWERRRRLSRGSPVWRYLTHQRALPDGILAAADAADGLREGPYGSGWFAHRDGAGLLTGIEMRGPGWRGFSAGGAKTLFRLPGSAEPLPRVAVCEAAIDALSLAAIEHLRRDTLYAATAGGMGAPTLDALRQVLGGLATGPAGLLVAATDADAAGRRTAHRLALLAAESRVRFEAILPPGGHNDWNDALRAAGSGGNWEPPEGEKTKEQ